MKKISQDFFLSFLASNCSIAIVHLLILPLLARTYMPEQYGICITIYGFANTIIGSFGGALNNARLIVNSEYIKREIQGDFLPILLISCLFSSGIVCVYTIRNSISDKLSITLLLLYVVFGIVSNYGNVVFRLIIDYKKNLYYNLFIIAGQFIGVYFILKKTINWLLPFSMGQVFGVLFICFFSELFKEPFKKTELFFFSAKKYLVLIFTSFGLNVLTYLDRFLLLPLLGGEAVSTYTTAAFFGKTLSMFSTPFAGVLLSYYAQKDYVMNIRKYWRINAIVLVCGSFFCFASVFVAGPVTGFLYPDLIEGAEPYLFIANASSIILLIANMVQPAILVFSKTYWQIIIQVIYGCLYLGLGIYGAKTSGIQGFAVAALITAIAKLVFLYLLGSVSIIRDDKK